MSRTGGHDDRRQVVLVDLTSIELKGDTVASTFPGEDNTLTIYWCNQEDGNCVVGILTRIRKVF